MKRQLSDFDFQAGEMLLLDKPLEWTSFDVVNKLRYKIKHHLGVKKIKVGHAGTLDPLATGLLIICTGKMTKQIDNYQGLDKMYTGTMHIGATTASFDAEQPIDKEYPIDHITPQLLEEARSSFDGWIDQYPPMFSALKVNGVPLYKKARKGIQVEVKSRKVNISDFELGGELPSLDFSVTCSKGTYIRSLAYDFGKKLESGAYLTALRRERIGKYSVKDAMSVDKFVAMFE